MPIFDLRCTGCQKVTSDLQLASHDAIPSCGVCGSGQEKVWFPGGTPLTTAFRSGWYEHLDIEPVKIRSKGQLRDECAKRGLFSEYASD